MKEYTKEKIVSAFNKFSQKDIPGAVGDAAGFYTSKYNLAHWGFAAGLCAGWMARDGLAKAEAKAAKR